MKGLLSAACSPVSCALSLALYGRWEALCARAYAEDWRLWIAVMDALMGAGHCRESWEWWRGRPVKAASRSPR